MSCKPRRSCDLAALSYNTCLESPLTGFVSVDRRHGEIVYFSRAALDLLAPGAVTLMHSRITDYLLPDEGGGILARLAQLRDGAQLEDEVRFVNSRGRGGWLAVRAVAWGARRYLLSVVEVTAERLACALLKTRRELSELARRGTTEDVMRGAVDAAEAFTGSGAGFFHSVDEEGEECSPGAWSSATVSQCGGGDAGERYPICGEGAWGECLHTHRPQIDNGTLPAVGMGGAPEGRLIMLRRLAVPVLQGKRMVAILGVGNKETEYLGEDTAVVQEIASMAIDLVEHKRAESDLREAHDLLESRVAERTAALEDANASLTREVAERARAEESLRQSEERSRYLATLLERSTKPFATGYPDGTIGYLNTAFELLTGYTREELQGMNWIEVLTPPEWRPLEAKKLEELHAHPDKAVRYEKEFIRKDGSRVAVELLTHVVVDDRGGALYYYAFLDDLTERKRGEEVLRQHRDHLDRLVQERTAELETRNSELASEIAVRGRMEEEMRSYMRRLIELEEELRKELAAELHDDFGRDLTALGINLTMIASSLPHAAQGELAPTLEDSVQLVQGIGRSVRAMMSNLRPPVLDDYGVMAALEWLAERHRQRTGISISVTAAGSLPRLTAEKEMALFRVAQESLTNVVKHAQADRISISVRNPRGKVRLTISDNGRGFSPAKGTRRTEGAGWGLTIMRERVELLGGSFRLRSTPGGGTTISVELAQGGGGCR